MNRDLVVVCDLDDEDQIEGVVEFLTEIILSQAGQPPSGAAPWLEDIGVFDI